MIVDVPELAKEAGVKRDVETSDYEPPKTITDEAVAIYLALLLMWRKRFKDSLESYQPWVRNPDGSLSGGIKKSPMTDIDAEYRGVVLYQAEKLEKWVSRVDGWNAKKVVTATSGAVGVNVSPYMRLIDVQEALEAAIQSSVSLIGSMQADMKSKVEAIMFDAIANRRNKKYITDELAKALEITKKRARRIAGDQTHKLNIALTAQRNIALGIEEFVWVSRRDDRVRPLHRHYNGKVYRWNSPPADGLPGWSYNCRCVAKSVIKAS